ncbi:MAG: hypothetical protein ACK4NA_09700 [Alphaproteobacteria bacterium]
MFEAPICTSGGPAGLAKILSAFSTSSLGQKENQRKKRSIYNMLKDVAGAEINQAAADSIA